jgi:hypothetical protein
VLAGSLGVSDAVAQDGSTQVKTAKYGILSFIEIKNHPDRDGILDDLKNSQRNRFDEWEQKEAIEEGKRIEAATQSAVEEGKRIEAATQDIRALSNEVNYL